MMMLERVYKRQMMASPMMADLNKKLENNAQA
jgi:hypothetical protein